MKLELSYVLILLFSCNTNKDKVLPTEMETISKWFSAWDLVSKDIYRLSKNEFTDFVFFDNDFVYSTSKRTISGGETINGPSFFGKKLRWKKKKHQGKITLPSGETVPISLMVFASPPIGIQKNPFFVMPLVSFWKKAGVKSNGISFDYFLTGIFLHEFSHTQQMKGLGKEITKVCKKGPLKFEITDEIVQSLFSKDTNYENSYFKENEMIFDATNEPNVCKLKFQTKQIVNHFNQRQFQFFKDDLILLKSLDKLFLTLEGIGQYSMYRWLIHREGGNISAARARKATSTQSWVQNEGFGLALLLSKYSNSEDWGNYFFGSNKKTLIDLIACRSTI